MAFPDFIIPGAAKSGTTALSSSLRTHPQIHMPEHELNFYSMLGRRQHRPPPMVPPRFTDLDSYLAALRNSSEEAGLQPKTTLIGEKSVSYLYGEWVEDTINNIRRLHPHWQQLKIIILLRDPVDRIYSHYVSNLRAGLETLPFPAAVQAWEERRSLQLPFWFDYRGVSRYSKPVAAYLENFSQVKICFFEKMLARPHETVADIFHFLGVDPEWRSANVGSNPNPSLVPRSINRGRFHTWVRSSRILLPLSSILPARYRRLLVECARQWAYQRPPRLAPELRASLLSECIEDLHKLERLLGRSLPPAWFEPSERIAAGSVKQGAS